MASKSIRSLVNEAVELNQQINELNERLSKIKQNLADRGEGLYVGTCGINISVTERTSVKFDQKMAKSLLKPAQLAKCFKETTSTVVRFEME